MTLSRRFRCLVPLLTVALVAIAVSACTPVKDTSGSCTQFWRGYVLASDHNYAGLGAFSGSDRYMCKDTPTQGVRAQLQHLRNYADQSATHQALGNPFEPRVKYDAAAFDNFPLQGQAPTWNGLEGRWAVPGGDYADNIINIYNGMRTSAGKSPVSVHTAIMGPSELTAAQIEARVCAVGRCATWRPEITPAALAQIYINEGTAVGVRGDIAFAQSVLETGWFAWPGSYGTAEVSTADAATTGYFDLQHVTARN
jgi:hypothetical protein